MGMGNVGFLVCKAFEEKTTTALFARGLDDICM
jgi:hypothetical protein